jgi:hypothetical protein
MILEHHDYVPRIGPRIACRGWHWHDPQLPAQQRRQAVAVTVSERCARPASTGYAPTSTASPRCGLRARIDDCARPSRRQSAESARGMLFDSLGSRAAGCKSRFPWKLNRSAVPPSMRVEMEDGFGGGASRVVPSMVLLPQGAEAGECFEHQFFESAYLR